MQACLQRASHHRCFLACYVIMPGPRVRDLVSIGGALSGSACLRKMSVQTTRQCSDEYCLKKDMQAARVGREALLVVESGARWMAYVRTTGTRVEILVHQSRANSLGHLFLVYSTRPSDRRTRPFKKFLLLTRLPKIQWPRTVLNRTFLHGSPRHARRK